MITIDHRVVQGQDDPLDPGRIPEFTDIITADLRLNEILSRLPIYAGSDLPILLTGEPGTGKELVAMAIFSLGPARRRSCQRLNCAALTESLASSELFGHVRGLLPTPSTPDRANSGWPMRRASSWMRWGSCPYLPSPSCSGRWSRGRSNRWAATPRCRWMCAW